MYKKRQKLLTVIIFVSIVATFAPGQATATIQIRTESKCAKAGMSKSVRGNKYSCTNTRGKLVWTLVKSSKNVAPRSATSQVIPVSKII